VAIKIDVITDVAQAVSGTGKLADKYNDVSDALMDVARDGDTAGDKIEAAFRDGAKDVTKTERALKEAGREGTRAGDKIEKGLHEGTTEARKMDDALDALGKSGTKAGRDIGDGMDKASQETGESFKTIKEEARSNLSETVSSFRGDAEDIGQIFQDIAGGVVADLGPTGLVLGAGIAAGIGVGIAALQGLSEQATADKEEIIGIAQAIREHGGTFAMESAIKGMDDYGDSIADTKEWWEIFQQEAYSGWEVLRDQANKTGLSMSEMFSGRFGNDTALAERALAKVEDRLKSYTSEVENSRRAQREQGERVTITTKTMEDQIRVTEETRDKIKDHIKEIRAAEEIERARREAIKGTTEAIKESLDAEREKTSGASSVIDAQQDQIQTQRDLADAIKEEGRSRDISTEAGSKQVDLWQQLVQVKNDEIDAMIQSGATAPEVASKYNAMYSSMLSQAQTTYGLSKQAAADWLTQLGLVPPEKVTELRVSGKDKAIADGKEAAKKEEKPVDLTVTGADGVQKQIASLPSDVPVHVGVTEQGTVGMTQAAIDSIHGKDVRVGATEEGTARMTQATIDRIRGHDVRVGATEQGTARQTQETIDRIHGKDVDIRVNVPNLWAVQQALDALTAPRSVSVTVNEVPGRRVDH